MLFPTPTAAQLAKARAAIEEANTGPFYGRDMLPIVTTGIDRTACLAAADAEFDALAEHIPGIRNLHVDTYTMTGHPVPGSDITFDLYVKVIIVGRPEAGLE